MILVGVDLVFLGSFLVPIIPVSMNFASELTFPLAPAATNGILLMMGQACGAAFGLIGAVACQHNPLYLLGTYLGFAILSTVLAFFVKEDLKKLKFQKEQERLADADEEVL